MAFATIVDDDSDRLKCPCVTDGILLALGSVALIGAFLVML